MYREEENYESIKKVQELSPECMVLLKSNHDFPLKEVGDLALFGSGARKTYKGGRGSGDVYVKHITTIEEGLTKRGFHITTTKWLDAYAQALEEGKKPFRNWLKKKIEDEGMDKLMENLSIVMPEPEYEIELEGEGDVAVYVLTRLCGEGTDRQYYKGDFLLTTTEIRDILTLQEKYNKFLLVLNTGGIIDLSPIVDKVENILILSQLGVTTGDAFASVLTGETYPSGKLTTTWAKADDYSDIEFGMRDDIRYKEGIYVGYRYFDSINKEVVFPFGHGLGYTKFELTTKDVTLKKSTVSFDVSVKNSGNHIGKEVVQVYLSMPSEKLDQPYQVLAGFAKTPELKPNQEASVTIKVDLANFASTDVDLRQRILETGSYYFRVGESSRSTKLVAHASLSEQIVIEDICLIEGEVDFEDWKPSKDEMLNKTINIETKLDELDGEIYWNFELKSTDFTKIVHNPSKIDEKALEFVQELSDEELVYLCVGDFEGGGSKNIIADGSNRVLGAGGDTTEKFEDRGIPQIVMTDGPAGIRVALEYGIDENGKYRVEQKHNPMELEDKYELIPPKILSYLKETMNMMAPEERKGDIHEQICTSVPIATAVAQSWNLDVAATIGDIISAEMKKFGISIWLAPGLNIQRHPLCGRTFEYYSEDPLISGKFAAAITSSVQKSSNCAVTVKHFICNNQESNRFRSSSMVNQRAIRDIYAKGFEIVVKEAQPHALMSSYNLLNGEHTSERVDLLEIILRQEWGFNGIVISDFMTGDKSASDETNKYRKFGSAPSIKGGTDLLMPGGQAHYDNILAALKNEDEEFTLSRKEVERCAARNVAMTWLLTQNN